MSKLSTRPVFTNPTIQDTDEFWINVDNLDTTFTSQKMTGLQLKSLLTGSPLVENVVFIDQNTPTTGGVTFDPNTPATEDTLYISSTNGSTWIWNGTAYVTYSVPVTASTPFYLEGTTTDAGNNKTNNISRLLGISALSFNTKKNIISSGISNHNKWWKVFEYTVGSPSYNGDSFTIQMNEGTNQNVSTIGKSVVFDIMLHATTVLEIMTINVKSGVTTFDLSNIEVLFNATTKKVSFYYRPTSAAVFSNWLVLNANISNTTVLVFTNTLIGVSLSGEPNDTITTKTITLNKVNGVYTLPSTAPTAGQVLGYLGAGTTAWVTPSSSGGVTYFTEAQNTSAPNATVNVDSITAIASTANADVAIVPKGTGAFTLAVPDNTTVGGNKRGTNAVDLQSIRSSNSQVASGVSSFLAGNGSTANGSYSSAIGYLNTASGTYSSAIGYGNIASNTFSFSFGNSCTASGDRSIAMGGRAKATGEFSICLASNFYSDSTASGQNSTLVGSGNVAGTFALGLGFQVTAAGAQSSAIGYNSNTFATVGRVAIGGAASGSSGAAQKGIISYRQLTTDATPTILTTNNATTFNDNAGSQLALQNQQVMRFKGSITAKKSGTTDIAIWDIDGVLVRGANAASTVLTVGNVNVVTNIPAWVTPVLEANLSASVGGLKITITGVIATNIQWFAVLDTVENIYA